MLSLFKKPIVEKVDERRQELATVEVRDIKQYLIDEYERSQRLFNQNEYLKGEIERAGEIKIKYDFVTNNIIVTVPSFTINITQQTLNISIQAITFDLNINFVNKNINCTGNFTKIKVEYNNLKFNIERLKIGKTIENSLDIQIEDFICQLKSKTLFRKNLWENNVQRA